MLPITTENDLSLENKRVHSYWTYSGGWLWWK